MRRSAPSKRTGSTRASQISSAMHRRVLPRGYTMLPSRYFVDLTQPEIAAQLKKNPLVILPAGSIQQHGPHLPTGTDTLAANVIAHAVAERMDGLVLPPTPLGLPPLHMPFHGPITL